MLISINNIFYVLCMHMKEWTNIKSLTFLPLFIMDRISVWVKNLKAIFKYNCKSLSEFLYYFTIFVKNVYVRRSAEKYCSRLWNHVWESKKKDNKSPI